MNIYDIAKEAGVSPATISRVLNGNQHVKKSTRDKVSEIIKNNGYIPNVAARSLSVGQSQTIAFLVPDVENPFFGKILHGITDKTIENDYNVFMFGTNESSEREHKILTSLSAERVKGIIIIPVSEADCETKRLLSQFEQHGVPVVLIDRDIKGGDFDGIFSEDENGVFEAIELFIKEGHQDIGIISGPPTSRPGLERLKGYYRALDVHGISTKNEYIVDGCFRLHESYLAMKALMELERPPSAVFASNNMTTLGCLKYMKEHGMRLQRDISIVGFDDIPELEYADMHLTVVERPVYQMGCEAMDILENRFASKKDIDRQRWVVCRNYVKTCLVKRGSEKIDKFRREKHG